MTKISKVAVIGAGSWGTALALQLARNGLQVNLWGHEKKHIDKLLVDNQNTEFLPSYPFPDNIIPTASLSEAVLDVLHILIVIPSKAYREFLHQLKPLINQQTRIFWASKGFEIESGKFLHELVVEELGIEHFGVISGPTFATEVAKNLPAAVTCAGNKQDSTQEFAELLHGEHFRCYTSSDVIGVEIGGALKNVLAIAVGAADGLGFGANTRAALITRGLAEVMRFGEKMGAQKETLMGLSGLGDLILTSTDNQSRNRRFGLAIGQGQNVEQAIQSIGQTVEGYRAAKAIYLMAQKQSIALPIMGQVYKVLYEGKSPAEAVSELESREQKSEIESI
ncbi:MAG: NAD(P)-dependent glycerol-3-phosphate dehydrogenase [Gammaproteobacteria bacterium]|nr:NAD(P)-dependent glycerol-3-phosphate dehydrogenase [Gammaproteobacteria bacterium]